LTAVPAEIIEGRGSALAVIAPTNGWNLLDPGSQTYLPDEALAAVMRQRGVRLGQNTRFVCSCGSGVSACVVALALEKLGEPRVQVYDGSWTQWGSDPSLPVETGEAVPAGAA